MLHAAHKHIFEYFDMYIQPLQLGEVPIGHVFFFNLVFSLQSKEKSTAGAVFSAVLSVFLKQEFQDIIDFTQKTFVCM